MYVYFDPYEKSLYYNKGTFVTSINYICSASADVRSCDTLQSTHRLGTLHMHHTDTLQIWPNSCLVVVSALKVLWDFIFSAEQVLVALLIFGQSV